MASWQEIAWTSTREQPQHDFAGVPEAGDSSAGEGQMMATEAAGMPVASETITVDDRRMAVWTGGIALVTLLIWSAVTGGEIAFSETEASNPIKYILYTLPVTLAVAYYGNFGRSQIRVDPRGTAALLIYVFCAMTAMVSNLRYDFYAIRDFAIISGYLLMFVFWFRAPDSIADLALATLALSMTVAAANRIASGAEIAEIFAGGLTGFLGLTDSSSPSLFGSNSIFESALGLSVGIIFLYYVHIKKWRHALVAVFLMFVAFKRISFLGVALAIGFDAVLCRSASLATSRILAVIVVVALSITAIFSTQIFEGVAEALDLEETSPNSVSLGRYIVALNLWDELDSGSPAERGFGFGPGAADGISRETSQLNPHNDWLKILFDYGVFGFISMHVVLFLILARHRLGLMLYLYTASLMMSDNIFLYMSYHPFLAMVMCAERGREGHGCYQPKPNPGAVGGYLGSPGNRGAGFKPSGTYQEHHAPSIRGTTPTRSRRNPSGPRLGSPSQR